MFSDFKQRLYLTQFWVYLFLVILSILCSLFALYHFMFDRALRRALHNHVIIVLLVINLFYACTNMQWSIYYFRWYNTLSEATILRLVVGYIDWTFYELQFILYAWVSIERHIFIFHDHLVSTKKKRFFCHYLPPVVLTMYCVLYYTTVIFFAQCQNVLANRTIPTFFPCAFRNRGLFMYETVIHSLLPTLTIVVSSFALLCRVLWRKYRMHRQIHWRKHRKMTVQLLSISFLYLIFPFPFLFLTFLYLCGLSSEIGADFSSYGVLSCYYPLLLFSCVCTASTPELRAKLAKILRLRQQRIVHPEGLTVARTAGNVDVVG